jgi:hypothetical protein
VASGGPGLLFSIHDATRKVAVAGNPQGSRVSIWILDKRALLEGERRHSKEEVEALLVLLRKAGGY